MSHRRSNEVDLKIKYDYLYTLASKVSSEAKLIMVKRNTDPDRTMLSYMQQEPVRLDHDYVLDSDYSSSHEDGDGKLEARLDRVTLEDLEEIDKIPDEVLDAADDEGDDDDGQSDVSESEVMRESFRKSI
jgi:hypothetical protein